MIIDTIINELIKKRKKAICNSSSYIEPKFQIFISHDLYDKMVKEISENQSLSMYYNESYDLYYRDKIYDFPVYKVRPNGSFTWTIHMVERYTGQSTWEYVFNRYIYRSVTNEREYNERQMMIRVKNKIDRLKEENEYLRNRVDKLESESKIRIEDNIKKLYNEGYLSLEDILKASWYEQRKVIDKLKDDIRILKEEMRQYNGY